MHTTHLLGAGVLLAISAWAFAPATASPQALPPATLTPPPPPRANGHFALVVEGDRDALSIRSAVAKPDPWSGPWKGLQSRWSLAILAADGTTLAEVPLDLAHFDLAAERKGGPIHVEGCVVRDPRIAMLVNVPRYAAAFSYSFVRRDGAVVTPIGAVAAARVEELARGGR